MLACSIPAFSDTPEQIEQYRYGIGLVQRRMYDEASKVLQRLTSDPTPFSMSDAAIYWLAECEYRTNNFVKAAGYYKQIVTKYPESQFYDRAAYGLGWSHVKDNNPKSAVEAYELVTKKDIPLWIDANLKIGWLMVKYDMDTDAMITVYENLLKESSLRKEQKFECNLQIAVGRFNQKLYKVALEFFQKAYEFAPAEKQQAVRYYIAECNFRINDYETSASEYAKTIALGVNTVLGQKSAYYLAWSHIKNGTGEKAIPLLTKEVENSESVVRGESLKTLVDILMNKHDYDKAIDIITKYSSILNEEDRSEQHFTKSLALARIGEFEKSIKEFNAFIKTFPKHEKVPEAYYQIGLVNISLGRFKEAIKDFDHITSPDTEASLREKAIYRTGECWFNLGNITVAGDCFNKVIKLFPKGNTRVDALYQIGELAYLDHNYEDALTAFNAIGESDNELAPQSVFRSGEVLMKAKRWNEAVAKFEQYLKMQPEGKLKEDAYFKIGLSQLELKDDAKAIEAFSALLNAKGYFRQEARFNIAEIASRLENYPLAIQHYKAILAEEPKHPLASQAKRQVGIALYKLKDYENAIVIFKEILKDYPSSDVAIPESRLWLGKSLVASGKIDEGILEVLKVPILYPGNSNSADAYFTAARGYKLVGQTAKMKQMYEETLKHKPTEEMKHEAEEVLKNLKQSVKKEKNTKEKLKK